MIPLPLGPALALFSGPNIAFDTVGAYVDGRWRETTEPDYEFSGSVQPSSARDLKILPQGNAAGGEVTVYSDRKLFFTDIDDQGDGWQNGRQTFVRYGGFVYRVLAVADWTVNTGHFVYIARRYVKR